MNLRPVNKNKHVGTFVDVGCFSLHPRKSITTGEGGIITTNNEELAKEAGKYANTIFHPVSTCRMGNDENAVVPLLKALFCMLDHSPWYSRKILKMIVF